MENTPFTHPFIFSSGHWHGEGKILLNMVEEELFFNTKWTVQDRDFAGKVGAAQEIKIRGLSDDMCNELTFYNFQPKAFSVDMENQNLGKISGTGVYDDKTIAWEFRGSDVGFEGFETYALQPDGSYHMRGEYITSDQFRTQIEARIEAHPEKEPGADSEKEGEGRE